MVNKAQRDPVGKVPFNNCRPPEVTGNFNNPGLTGSKTTAVAKTVCTESFTTVSFLTGCFTGVLIAGGESTRNSAMLNSRRTNLFIWV